MPLDEIDYEQHAIQIGSYFLPPKASAEMIKIVTEQWELEKSSEVSDEQWPDDWEAIKAAIERIASGLNSQVVAEFIDGERMNDVPAREPERLNVLHRRDGSIFYERPSHEPEVAARVNAPYSRNERGQNTLLRSATRPPQAKLVLARDMKPRLSAGGTLIKGLLDEAAMSVTYAPSNVGKSFFMLDLAFHIATGRDWRGMKIKKPGAVLYVAAEGGYGFINRVVAIKRHYGLPDDADIPLAVLPCPVDLLDPKADRDMIVDLIERVAQEFNQPVVLLVLDTLSRIMAGGDENGPRDMTALVSNVDFIRDRSSAHVALVHHAGKDIARGARGHSSLRAATDTEIELTRTGEGADKSFTIAVRKQRELPGDNAFRCTFKSVYLGDDDDGKPVTSAVIEHAADAPPKPSKDAPTSDAVALGILRALIATHGQPLPERKGYPPGSRGVDEELWRRECDAQRLSTAEKESSRDRAFRRAYESLRFDRKVGARDGMVWSLD